MAQPYVPGREFWGPRAGTLPQRTFAYLLDGLCLVVIGRTLLPGWYDRVQAEALGLLQAALSPSLGFPGLEELWARGVFHLWALGAIIALALGVAWDFAWLAAVGGTPGQFVFNLRLVPVDDRSRIQRIPRQLAWRRTVWRRMLTSFAKPVFWLTSAMLVVGAESRDLPDRWAGTAVVMRRRG